MEHYINIMKCNKVDENTYMYNDILHMRKKDGIWMAFDLSTGLQIEETIFDGQKFDNFINFISRISDCDMSIVDNNHVSINNHIYDSIDSIEKDLKDGKFNIKIHKPHNNNADAHLDQEDLMGGVRGEGDNGEDSEDGEDGEDLFIGSLPDPSSDIEEEDRDAEYGDEFDMDYEDIAVFETIVRTEYIGDDTIGVLKAKLKKIETEFELNLNTNEIAKLYSKIQLRTKVFNKLYKTPETQEVQKTDMMQKMHLRLLHGLIPSETVRNRIVLSKNSWIVPEVEDNIRRYDDEKGVNPKTAGEDICDYAYKACTKDADMDCLDLGKDDGRIYTCNYIYKINSNIYHRSYTGIQSTDGIIFNSYDSDLDEAGCLQDKTIDIYAKNKTGNYFKYASPMIYKFLRSKDSMIPTECSINKSDILNFTNVILDIPERRWFYIHKDKNIIYPDAKTFNPFIAVYKIKWSPTSDINDIYRWLPQIKHYISIVNTLKDQKKSLNKKLFEAIKTYSPTSFYNIDKVLSKYGIDIYHASEQDYNLLYEIVKDLSAKKLKDKRYGMTEQINPFIFRDDINFRLDDLNNDLTDRDIPEDDIGKIDGLDIQDRPDKPVLIVHNNELYLLLEGKYYSYDN